LRPGVRIIAAVTVVAAGFTGGSAVGRSVGPVQARHPAPAHQQEPHAPATPTPRSAAASGAASTGLLSTEAGYTLVPGATTLMGAPGEVLTFRIVGGDGAPVTRYVTDHERDLHFVLVSRNLIIYSHLHPTLSPGGTWSVALPALPPALYHGYASFVPGDRGTGPGTGRGGDHGDGDGDSAVTLGVELLVPGAFTPVPLPETGPVAEVDGYTVRLEGTPTPGTGSILTFVVEQDGVPITDLDPYLGATAHLVAIRVSDLVYIHAHPASEAGNRGPNVPLHLELAAPGDYRLFLDFSHHALVHTAAFTLHVPRDRR
jgi:hypothetical protein